MKSLSKTDVRLKSVTRFLSLIAEVGINEFLYK